MSDQEAIDVRTVQITFVNGEHRSFAFEPKDFNRSNLASVFQQFVEQGYINLELDDQFIMVPISNVQTVEITPKPTGNLPYSIRILHEFDE